MRTFFVFDVESIGLHGEGFAVAGGVYFETGCKISEFCFSCDRSCADGMRDDREWVDANVPEIEINCSSPKEVRQKFWSAWMEAKAAGSQMAAECLWPVEARFVRDCVMDDMSNRIWDGPYPFFEISSSMQASGMDPMGKYERHDSEQPAHHPLSDARLSARLLSESLGWRRSRA